MRSNDDQADSDLRRALALAMDAAGDGQRELDQVNTRILEATNADAPWRERAALYADEALLFQRQAELAGAVAALALTLVTLEEGGVR